MTVSQLTMKLQEYCHEGRALDNVEILDANGNIICDLNKITLLSDYDRNVVQIKIHHKE